MLFIKECFLTLLIFAFISSANGQVTIGSHIAPNEGALLDLKQFDSPDGGVNSYKGLGLSRVKLQKLKKLDPCTDDNSAASQQEHVGLMLYNLTNDFEENLCEGLYVWDSELWQKLGEACPKLKAEVANSYIMDGQEYQFSFRANVPWQAVYSDPENMISSSKADFSGMAGVFPIKFTLAPELTKTKKAEIKFTDDNNEVLTATINGVIPYLNVSPASWSVPLAGGSLPVTVSTNSTLPVNVTCPDADVAINGYDLTVGNISDARDLSTTVTYSNGIISKDIKVTQTGPTPRVLSVVRSPKFCVEAATGQKIQVTTIIANVPLVYDGLGGYNPGQVTTCNVSWGKSGSNYTTIVRTTAKLNRAQAIRYWDIKLKSADGFKAFSYSVTHCQDGHPPK